MAGKTLYDKLWEAHEVKRRDDGSSLIYIDRHIIHEVTSPQAFEGLRLANRKPWRIDANIATPDHNVPTTPERKGGIEAIVDQVSRLQVQTLDENCDEYGIVEFKMNDERQGIVHVISPEQGAEGGELSGGVLPAALGREDGPAGPQHAFHVLPVQGPCGVFFAGRRTGECGLELRAAVRRGGGDPGAAGLLPRQGGLDRCR